MAEHADGGRESTEDPRLAFANEPALDLSDARVAILGAGSVGAPAAWCLASRGVGRLLLADRERLSPENLRRHTCGRSALEVAKPLAVAEFLQERFAHVAVEHKSFCFLESPAKLREVVSRAEIVVVAVDDEGVKHLIDSMLWELGRPAVFLGVYGGGWGAEAILVDPARQTPCYACSAARLGRIGVEVHRAESLPSYALQASHSHPLDWRRADLSSILPSAALGAHLVAAWLEDQRGHARLLQEFLKRGATAWRLALRHVPAWELGPWALIPVRVPRQPGCPSCGLDRARFAPRQIDRLLSD